MWQRKSSSIVFLDLSQVFSFWSVSFLNCSDILLFFKKTQKRKKIRKIISASTKMQKWEKLNNPFRKTFAKFHYNFILDSSQSVKSYLIQKVLGLYGILMLFKLLYCTAILSYKSKVIHTLITITYYGALLSWNICISTTFRSVVS